MTRAIDPKRHRDLLRMLRQLTKLHREIVSLVKAKLDAMKHADVQTLQQCVERERQLVERVQRCEGLRRQLMDVIGDQLGLARGVARRLTVSQLVSYVPKRQGEAILAATGELRNAVADLARVNRVAGVAADGLVKNLTHVFASVRPASGPGDAYTGEGVAPGRSGYRIFDAVG